MVPEGAAAAADDMLSAAAAADDMLSAAAAAICDCRCCPLASATAQQHSGPGCSCSNAQAI